jgi:hypothetical protein
LGGKHRAPTLFILCLDAVSSIAISAILVVLVGLPIIFFSDRPEFYHTVQATNLSSVLSFLSPANKVWEITSDISMAGDDSKVMYSAFYLSTLFTSIWLALIVLSAALLKFLAPLQRFTTWLFNVERHPLEAVGIVTAALEVAGQN